MKIGSYSRCGAFHRADKAEAVQHDCFVTGEVPVSILLSCLLESIPRMDTGISPCLSAAEARAVSDRFVE